MNPYIKRTVFESYEDGLIDSYHPNVRDRIRDKISQYNFQIEFIEPTWVIKEYYGGFDGSLRKREMANVLGSTPFGVLSVDRDKKKQCSKIRVWSDGLADGNSCYLINVPNGLFRQV